MRIMTLWTWGLALLLGQWRSSSALSSQVTNLSQSKAINFTKKKSSSRRLRLLTFDLDDTLFPIEPVVQDANDVMIRTIKSFGYADANEKDFTIAMKRIRKNLTGPITYSELRKRAIREEIERCRTDVNGQSSVLKAINNDDDAEIVETCFEAWINERYLSADRYLFPDAVEMLEQIRSDHPDLVIGAVTNGRGSPHGMKSISDYFEFCVSGEDSDVFPQRKPSRGIYDATLSRAASHIEQKTSLHPRRMKKDDDMAYWVHVGDDLVNDVMASSENGAHAIWLDVDSSYNKCPGGSSNGATGSENWSTATEEELEMRRILAQKAKGHIHATIDLLSELPAVINNLHE